MAIVGPLRHGDALMRSRIDRSDRQQGFVLMGLALLAVVQIGAILVIAHRVRHPPIVRPPDLAIGDGVPAIRGRDSLAAITTLPLRRNGTNWTVLLAFSPACAWCDSVAPRWKRWTEAAGGRIAVIGIASGDPSAALRYTRAHGWKIGELIVVDSALTGVLGLQLTRKTPWLFLIDKRGVLRYSGHGNEVGTIDSLVGASQ
jgi:hypothetical protein